MCLKNGLDNAAEESIECGPRYDKKSINDRFVGSAVDKRIGVSRFLLRLHFQGEGGA